MAELSPHLKADNDARPSVENAESENPWVPFTWMVFRLIPDLEAILEPGGVDPDPFDEIELQYPFQTKAGPRPEVYGGVDPGPNTFDGMGLQYPPLTTSTIRSPSPLIHNSLLDSRNNSDVIDEMVRYAPLEAHSSAFFPEAPFCFASEEQHFPASSPAPSFDSHNALQLDFGLDSLAFAQSASVTIEQVTTPASLRPSRAKMNNVVLPEVAEEVAGPDSPEDASDQYVPFTRSTTGKHRRVARSSSNVSHVTDKRPRPALPPRNVQLPLPISSPLSSPGGTFSSFISEANPWLCVCGWEQKNHRMPDLKRHICSHMQAVGPARWVCCGVPLAQAPAQVPGLRTLVHNGQVMVGSCNKTFSRRDALRRHLQNENNHCTGEVVEQSP